MDEFFENRPNVPTPEMLALVASAFRDGESTNIGANVSYSWRHIPTDRLWELLSSLNLKSLLFSPLVEEIPRHTPYIAPDLASFTRRRMIGTTGHGEVETLGRDLLVRSLEHRFSVFGHKIWLGDVEESVPAAVFCSAINESLTLVVTGADDGLIKVWSVGGGKLIATLRGHSAEVCDVRFSPCSNFLVSLCQDDLSVMIWKKQDQYFSLHRRIVERGSDDNPLKPMHIDFAACEGPSKLVIAYSEGVVVAYDCVETAIAEIGRFSLVQARSEIVCFGVLPSGAETVSIAVSVKRRQMSPSIFLVRLKAGGSPPRTAEYSYPVSGSATISQIQCAHHSSSFVANDDEATGSLVFFKEESLEYEQIVLVSPDGTLTDGSLLRNHLMHKSSSAIPLNFSVIDAVFTKNDEFILASVCGQPRNPTSIGEDDAGSVYCLLVFRTDTGRLVGILGQETCRDQIFAVGSIDVSNATSPFSYVFYGSYDGSLSVSKIRSWGIDGNELVVHDLARFNINTDRGSNAPRSILDAQASFDPISGDLVMVVSDSLGSVSVFTNTNHEISISSPSEQFFLNDYDPGIRVTTDGTLCDSRMVPLSDLMTPSPPIVARLTNSINSKAKIALVQKLDVKASVRKVERAPVSEEDRLRKKEREDRLQRLAAMVRGRSPEQRDHDQRLGAMVRGEQRDHVGVVSAVSERVNRRAAMEELAASRRRQALGLRPRTTTRQRNPSDDQDSQRRGTQTATARTSSEEDTEPRSRRRGTRAIPRTNITDEEDSSSDEESVASSSSSGQQQVVVVPTQLRRDVFIRNHNRQAQHVCCLCRKTPSPDLLGPFPISDLDDCFFHPTCLFSLTGLEAQSSEPPRLSFSNLDVLVRRAINQGKCAKVGGCLGSTRLGAGIKCYNCRLVYHYDCAISTAVNSGYYLDPARDPLFVCPRCDAPTGLDHFSRRPRWRREAHVRAWLNLITSGTTFVPQVGDIVIYFPPKIIDSGKPVSDLISQNLIRSMTDLSVLTWKSSPTPARVDSIDYVFPSFFDDEDRAMVMVVSLVGLQDGLSFKIHYRPRINASDVLVLKSRVDSALATNFLQTARPGMRVRIPVDGGVPDDGVIEHVLANTDGWECFEIKSVDDGSISRYSLWELDLGLTSQALECGIPEHQASFLIGWIRRIVQGPVKSARNRISVGPGMDVFKACPSTQEGGESYLEIIEYPMWLDWIVEKLEGSVYRSVDELRRDIACIHSNCEKYNDPNSLLVAEANTLVETLLLLVGLTVEDYPLYAVPPLPRGIGEERRNPSPPRSIRVIKRKVLICNHCGARREVDQEIFEDFTSTGKRVRCRWIGFVCEQEEDVEPSPLRPRRNRHN